MDWICFDLVWTIKLSGINCIEWWANLYKQLRSFIVSFVEKSLSPSDLIITFSISFVGLVVLLQLPTTELKAVLMTGEHGSALDAYFATLAWQSVTTWISQFALQPWKCRCRWLLSLESFCPEDLSLPLRAWVHFFAWCKGKKATGLLLLINDAPLSVCR